MTTSRRISASLLGAVCVCGGPVWADVSPKLGPGAPAMTQRDHRAAQQNPHDPRFTTEVATEAPVGADDANGTPVVVFGLLGHLYRITADGGGAVALTAGPAYDTDPALSPDGKLIVFRSDRDGLPGLYLIDAAGGEPRPLTALPEHRCGQPMFSVDGKEVIFSRLKGSQWDLMRIPATGGQPQTLAPLPGEIAGMALTRNKRLIYAVNADGKAQLFKFPDKAPFRVLPGAAGGLVGHPEGGVLLRWQTPTEADQTLAWVVPDQDGPPRILRKLQRTSELPRIGWLKGRQAFVVSDEGHLLLMRPDGTPAGEIRFHAQVQVITGPRAPTIAQRDVRPRGPVLLSSQGVVYAQGGRIYLQPTGPAGGPARALTGPAEVAYEPALSPDGKTLVYCRSAHVGAELVRIALGAAAPPVVMYSGGSLSAPAFTADGRGVVLTVGDPRGGAQLYRVWLGGTAAALPVHGERDLRGSPTPYGLCYTDAASGLSFLPAGETAGRGLLGPGPARAGVCSPDGKALAYVQGGEVYVAPLHQDRPVKDSEAQRLASAGSAVGAPPLWFGGDGRLVVGTPTGPRAFKIAALLAASAAASQAQGQTTKQGTPGANPPLSPALPVGEPVDLGGAAAGPAPQPLWIRDVSVIDPEQQSVTSGVTLVLEGGRVRWSGPNAKAPQPPAGARIIQGTKRYALAGLIDVQGHLGQADPRAYLAYGVTSVRVQSGAGLDRAASAADDLPVPRTLLTGKLRGISGAKEAEVQVDRLAVSGVGLLELPQQLDRRIRRAAAQAAAARGVRLVARAGSLEELVTAVADGAAVVEGRWDIGLLDDVLQVLLRSGVYVTTQLHQHGLGEHLLRSEEPGLNPVLLELALDGKALAAHRALVKGTGDAEAVLAERSLVHARRALFAGVLLLPASGGAGIGVFPGVSLVRELEALGRAGVSPWQVLRLATVQTAEALGLHDAGQVVVGDRADLVLLSGNPAEDVRNLERVVLTIRGGWAYRPELLLIDQRYRTISAVTE